MSNPHTEAMTELKRQLAEETTAARTIDAEAEAAAADLASARDAVVTAHADNNGPGVRKATAARDRAEAHSSELADRQAAARVRVERAEHAAQAYEADHALDLIAELEPAGLEAVEQLQHHAAHLVAADRQWRTVSAEVTRLLRHVPGAAPHQNAKGEHALSPVITAIRRAGDEARRVAHDPRPCVECGRSSRRTGRTGLCARRPAAGSASAG